MGTCYIWKGSIDEENTGIQEFWQSDQNSLRYRQNTGTAQNKFIVKMTDPYPLYKCAV